MNQGKWKHSSSWQPIFSTALRQVQPFHHLIEGAGEHEQEEPVMAASPFAMNVIPEDAETGGSMYGEGNPASPKSQQNHGCER